LNNWPLPTFARSEEHGKALHYIAILKPSPLSRCQFNHQLAKQMVSPGA
jgi:hypothetical protein